MGKLYIHIEEPKDIIFEIPKLNQETFLVWKKFFLGHLPEKGYIDIATDKGFCMEFPFNIRNRTDIFTLAWKIAAGEIFFDGE